VRKKTKNSLPLDEADFLISHYFERWSEIAPLIDNLVLKYKGNKIRIKECCLFIVLDQYFGEVRSNYNQMSETLAKLKKLKPFLTAVINQYPGYCFPFPKLFWGWHDETISIITTDMELFRELMGSEQPSRGAKPSHVRNFALKDIMRSLKADHVSSMIEDVANLAVLLGAFKDGPSSDIHESLRKIYYSKSLQHKGKKSPKI